MLRSLQSNVALAEFYSFPRAVVLHCQVTSSILRTPYVSLTHVSYSGLFLKSCMSMPGYVIRSSRVAHSCKGMRIATLSYRVRPWTLLRDMRYKYLGCERGVRTSRNIASCYLSSRPSPSSQTCPHPNQDYVGLLLIQSSKHQR